MSKTFFASDGSYGDAEGLVIINTTQWGEKEWAMIEQSSDYGRLRVAIQINERMQ